MLDRREKYNKIIKNNSLTINVVFDITALDLMCSYIVSGNKHIHRGSVINMRNLFLMLNMKNYAGDQEKLQRIDFIMKGIEARLEYNLTDKNMIISHIFGGFQSDLDYSQFRELNNDELRWINSTISETLKYAVIYGDIDKGLALFTKFKATDYADRGPIVKEIEEFVKQMQVKFRRAKAEDESDITFRLDGDSYSNAMREAYRKLTSPSHKLCFGTQALNLLTGGGVESGRVYTILGLPGEGKSSTMLDMAIQIKKYNKNYICKDPTKKPCVVLLIMENGTVESISRMFSMCVCANMTNFSEDEAVELLKTKGQLSLSDADPINLIIKFRPNLSEDTSYLYTLVEDLEDEGYETICVLQDYMKRIRSVDGSFGGDLRQQLGAVVNEFKTFATIKDIPVITASQLNRDATKHIDEARTSNKADLVRLIGRSNVGESNLILENSDWVALIAPEYDTNNNKYLGIQRVKSRYRIDNDVAYAYLPYITNTIKFIEDFYAPVPVHRLSMREGVQLNDGGRQQAPKGLVNEIKDFTEFNNIKLPKNDTPNIFMNSNSVISKYFNLNKNKKEMFKKEMISPVSR